MVAGLRRQGLAKVAAGGPRRAIVKEFRGVPAADTLTITLKPKAAAAVLCGIEVVAE